MTSYKDFIKSTKSSENIIMRVNEEFNEELKAQQKGSQTPGLSDIPTPNLNLLQNRYSETGSQGRKILSALSRLDIAWDRAKKMKKSGAAKKKRDFHMSLRTNYEMNLNKISKELEDRNN